MFFHTRRHVSRSIGGYAAAKRVGTIEVGHMHRRDALLSTRCLSRYFFFSTAIYCYYFFFNYFSVQSSVFNAVFRRRFPSKQRRRYELSARQIEFVQNDWSGRRSSNVLKTKPVENIYLEKRDPIHIEKRDPCQTNSG